MGWAWFFVGLLLALFFGGAVRALLSEEQVRSWIETTLAKEAPPYDVTVGTARIQLADGIFPRLGLEVGRLEIKPKDRCRVPLQVRLEKAFLPVNVREALAGKLKFGTLRAEGLRVLRLERECPDAAAATASKPAAPPDSAATATSAAAKIPEWVTDSKKFFNERWVKELRNSQRWLEGLEVRDFRIDGLNEPISWIEITEMQAKVLNNPDRVKASMSFRPGKAWDTALGGPPLEMDMSFSETAGSLELRIALGEGRLNAVASVDLSSMEIKCDTELDFVPAAQVTAALRRWKVITDPLDPKRTWLTGGLKWTQSWTGEPETSISAEAVSLTGDPGEVLLPVLEVANKSGRWTFQPFTVELKKFSLRHLLGFLGRKGYKGVIADFGSLSGMLNVASPEEMSFAGRINDLELAFSRRSIRARQKFKTIAGELGLKQGRVTAMVNTFDLTDGILKGLISLNLDRRLLDGIFQIRIDELQFQPEVQRIMLDGVMAPLAVFGQGRMEGGQVSAWSGELGTNRIDSANWAIDTLKVRSEFAKGQMALSIRALGAELLDDNPMWRKFKPVFAGQTEIGSPLQLKHISGRVEIFAGGGRWRNTMATTKQGEILVSSYGNWQNGTADGLVSLDIPGAKPKGWDLSGPWLDLVLGPSVRSARDLRKLEQ
jgi:hypothetical protein